MQRRAAIVLLACGALALPALAQSVAIKGYDPVAYFEPGRPTRGSESIAYEFDGARYLFSSRKNRDLFAREPDRYAPQFGGLCAANLAHGRKVEADPNAFVVRDGKLYLFQSLKGVEAAKADPKLLTQAHQHARK